MFVRIHFLLILFIFLPFTLIGENNLLRTFEDSVELKKEYKDPFLKHAVAPAIFLGLSGVAWQADTDVRAMRDRYVPDFQNRLDDYTQYAPGALALGLKLSGVKGRNSLGRSVINWGGGMLIMGALVNGIKYSARVMRPDGTTKNSFPSGHTATAFMNAAFLHKEYGPVNSMYSVLGYTMSTYTGISRSLNNRHWLSDILAGAGIGILSTELSYRIIDSFYKNKGDYFTSFDGKIEIENPSFISARMGQAFYIDMSTLESLGLEGAVEGAFFFNKKWGIGGEIAFMHMPFGRETFDLFTEGEQIEGLTDTEVDIQSIGLTTLLMGGYYSKFIGKKFILQGKLLTGPGIGVGGDIDIKGKLEENPNEEISIPFMEFDVKKSWVVGGGVSFTALIAPTLGLSLYVDYQYTNPQTVISISKEYSDLGYLYDKERLDIHALTCGLKLVSFF